MKWLILLLLLVPSVVAEEWSTVPDGEYAGLEYRIADVYSKVVNETNESITTKQTTEIHIRGEEYNPNRKLAAYTPFNFSHWDEWEQEYSRNHSDENITTLTVIEYTTSVSVPQKDNSLRLVVWLNIVAAVLLLLLFLIMRKIKRVDKLTPAQMARRLLASGHDEQYVHKVCEAMQKQWRSNGDD